MNIFPNPIKITKRENFIIVIGLVLALLVGFLAVYLKNYFIPFIPVIVLSVVIFLILLFREPFLGLVTLILYSFFFGILGRETGNLGSIIPFGFGIEILLLLTFISVWYNSSKYDFSVLKNDMVYFFLFWFLLSVVEAVNPAGASIIGWLQEFRSVALYPLFVTILGLILINNKKRINFFIALIIFSSVVASFYGLRQQYFGLTAGEWNFLNSGAATTHLLNGKLRVFSFYTDAGQFGASQAQFALLCLILALGLKKWSYKFLAILASIISFWGMLLSGTRGALFALLAGAVVAVILTKKLRLIIFGFLILVSFVGILKFTNIGNSNYGIYRMRSALNPEDASLNVRFNSQKKLREYMSSYPFGGGLGVIGAFGYEYNKDKFLSTIEPDSYWVKVWAMYGIVGFLIFFCGWMYLIGKSFGIVWNINDKSFRIKLIALVASVAGMFFCSYGNEVMNGKPSLFVIHLALAIIYLSPRFDSKKEHKQIIT